MIGDNNKDDGDDVGYYYKDSCVPLAKRWSAARLDTNITLIMLDGQELVLIDVEYSELWLGNIMLMESSKWRSRNITAVKYS